MTVGRLSSDDDQRAGATSLAPARHFAGSTRGSVLLPVVAAMLILLAAGTALAELFAAQRTQSVLSIESGQAFWVAEAGLWHAAHEATDIPAPVSFAGGDYTVTKSANDYVATGTWDQGARVASFTFTSSSGGGSGGGGTSNSPLDEAGSAATAINTTSRIIQLQLISTSSSDVVIESFAFTADTSTVAIRKLKLDSKEIWRRTFAGAPLPTGVLALNRGTTSHRTVAAGASPTLQIEFRFNPLGTVAYTLVFFFTDGSTSTMSFSIAW